MHTIIRGLTKRNEVTLVKRKVTLPDEGSDQPADV